MVPGHCTGALLFLFTLVSFAWADYYIDDTNTTLTYASGPKAAWAPYAVGAETLELLLPNGTYEVIDAFVCYNHTYRYAACFDTDSCLLTVPFTGSGIAIYVYQAGPVGINASITIDGAHAETSVLNAPPGPAYQVANVSMFDVQQLLSGPHTLQLLINDLFGSYSGMMFDYAYINESLVTSPPTSSASLTSSGSSTSSGSATPTTTSISSPPSSGLHVDVGVVVGSVVGGIAVMITGIIAFLWMRRRRREQETIGLHFEGEITAHHPPSNQSRSTNVAEVGRSSVRNTESLVSIPLIPNRRAFSSDQTPGSVPSGQDTIYPFTSSPSNSSGTQDRKTRLVLSNDVSNPPGIELATYANQGRQFPSEAPLLPQSSGRDTSPSLTDEQADFINSLYNNNVPAAAIARVMERMLADQHAGIREWERETRLARSNTITSSTAPPSYRQ
ncbi:hypothetical protein PAXRUDRAFT_822412 [Paxillus rubicundulus Ve08.2h10]|uniref:Unplaced genomic scaffold scaffold_29, whole genome shotgun sequence n=1 Tax=Paxillus rubicundulus Ve08.2h10 TaxID=930991 RepID=A0A0D0E9U4_9AGAM|nr:hypothetical protein PAXRUDRAFT_822412 [Paxillus rubicundulus Ve08.2h10]